MSGESAPSLEPGVHRLTRSSEPTRDLGVAPTPADLLLAGKAVRRYLPPTVLELSPELSRQTGRSVHLKLENCSPIRSFKARGAVAALARNDPDLHAAGYVTASTGNHGQGLALAAQLLGSTCTVVAPFGTDPLKLRQMEQLGATVATEGNGLSDAQEVAISLAGAEGRTYLEDGEDPMLMAGAASVALEMLAEQPDLDLILVPVGGGNLIAATLLAVDLMRSPAAVVGVQSSAAPGATLSWLSGELRSAPCHTFAGGLAAERPGRLALDVMSGFLETIAVVTEDDLRQAILTFYEATGFVIEGAAAAPLAALRRYPDDLPGERVGMIVSGGWLATDELRSILEAATSQPDELASPPPVAPRASA